MNTVNESWKVEEWAWVLFGDENLNQGYILKKLLEESQVTKIEPVAGFENYEIICPF